MSDAEVMSHTKEEIEKKLRYVADRLVESLKRRGKYSRGWLVFPAIGKPEGFMYIFDYYDFHKRVIIQVYRHRNSGTYLAQVEYVNFNDVTRDEKVYEKWKSAKKISVGTPEGTTIEMSPHIVEWIYHPDYTVTRARGVKIEIKTYSSSYLVKLLSNYDLLADLYWKIMLR